MYLHIGIISLMQCDWMLQLCLRIVLSAKPTELTGVVVLVDCIITLTFIFTIVAVEQSSLTKPDRKSRGNCMLHNQEFITVDTTLHTNVVSSGTHCSHITILVVCI